MRRAHSWTVLVGIVLGCGGRAHRHAGDAGNDAAADAAPDAAPPACGDGRLDPGEACDDGASNSEIVPDACRTDCRRAHCGDGVQDSRELCDDGNEADGDACPRTCGECGDGIFTPGEICFEFPRRFATTGTTLWAALADLDDDADLDIVASTEDGLNVLEGDGIGGFGEATLIPLETWWTGMSLGDLDGDGDVDLAAAVTDAVEIFDNDGRGLFAERISISFPGAAETGTGDFDGDLDVDVFVRGRIGGSAVLFNGGDGSFAPGDSFDANVWDFVEADIEGDGDLDVVGPTDSAEILINDGTGIFSVTPIDAGDSARAIAVADFDRDGALDVGVLNDHRTVGVLLGDRLGGFGPREEIGRGDWLWAIRAEDLGADGDADLVVAGGEDLLVLQNDGAGALGPSRLHVAGADDTALWFRTVDGADLDGDGFPEIVASNEATPELVVTRSRGDGSLAATRVLASDDDTRGFVIADLDADGDPDLATAGYDALHVSIHLGDGGGRFETVSTVDVEHSPGAIVAADMDGDGDVDLATLNRSRRELTVLWNDGAARFEMEHFDGGAEGRLATADLDANGAADIVVSGGHEVQVLLATAGSGMKGPTAFPTPAYAMAFGDIDEDGDLDLVSNALKDGAWFVPGDGAGGFGTARPVQTERGSIAVAVGDVDGDGHLDIVAGSQADRQVMLLRGQGDGSFDSPVDLGEVGYFADVSLADADDDGDLDVAALGGNPRATLSILQNRGDLRFSIDVQASFPAFDLMQVADLDGDGAPDIATSSIRGVYAAFASP